MGEKCKWGPLVDYYLTLKRLLISYLWCFALGFIVLTNSGVVTPYKRAFKCNDQKISKPFTGDTVSPLLFLLVLIFAPSIVFLLTEFYCFADVTVKDSNGPSPDKRKFRCVLRHFLLGVLYVAAITELLKVTVSEMRPHFLYSCQPDISCQVGLVSSFNCTIQGGPWWLKFDIYKSFPSGHASLSIYTLVFIYIYTEDHLKRSSTFRAFVQILFLCWALTCCITRITDNRHFWWDVMFGGILGIVGGLLTMATSQHPIDI